MSNNAIYNWKLGGNMVWQSPSNWMGLSSPTNYPNIHIPGSAYNDTAVFNTGSATPYSVYGLDLNGSGFATKVGNLIVSQDTVKFMQMDLEYNHLGIPYSGLQVNIINGAHVGVMYHSGWNLQPMANEHSALLVDNHATLYTEGTISNFVTRVTNGSSLSVSGYYANFNYAVSRGAPDADNETTIDKTSMLLISNGAHVSGGLLDNRGYIAIGGAGSTLTNTAVASHSTNEVGGRIVGAIGGTLAGTVINAGVIEAYDGNFHVTASVVNSSLAGVVAGSFQIDTHAVLELGTGSYQAMKFLSNAELDFDKGVDYRGVINGFSTGDKIDLLGQAVTAIYTTGTHAGTTNILVVNGSTTVESLTLQGSYSHSNLFAQADGHGGTLLAYGQASGSIHIS